MKKTLNLSEDIENPREFIINYRTDFLHKLKNYASILALGKERDSARDNETFMLDINNYRLAFHGLRDKMPDARSSSLLLVLLAHMDLAWNERKTKFNGETILADNMAMAYENLTDYLLLK